MERGWGHGPGGRSPSISAPMFSQAALSHRQMLRTVLQRRPGVVGFANSLSCRGQIDSPSRTRLSGLTAPSRSQSSLVGSLPGASLSQEALAKGITPKPPSLLVKALSNTLLGFMSSLSDLSTYGQALFVAPASQAGIPAGDYMAIPPEVTNYQLFSKADAAQSLNHPMYSVDGAGSYFELLSRYMRFVQDKDESAATAAAREALLSAEKAKNSAYEVARHEYIATQKSESGHEETFIDNLNRNKAYLDAWEVEKEAQKAYADSVSPDFQDVIRQLDIIKSANDRLEHKVGNNMPCNALSQDFISVAFQGMDKSGDKPTDSNKNLYYRPAYSLPDYEHICNEWSKAESLAPDGPYPISLHPEDLEASTWASLGHPLLDETPTKSLTPAQTELLAQIKASITFLGKPAALDVNRGLWDISPLRFAALAPDAPPPVQQPFVKTTKLLLAWGLRIDVELPETPTKSLPTGVGAFLMGIPLKSDPDNHRRLSCTVGGAFYPVLVAALGRVVGGA